MSMQQDDIETANPSMFTERVACMFHLAVGLDLVVASLLHEFKPILLGLFHGHQFCVWLILRRGVAGAFDDPVETLRGNVGRRDDAQMRIDEP